MNTNSNVTIDTRALVASMFKDLLLANEEVAFVPSWHNGTGYFSDICNMEQSYFNNVRFFDDSGRRGLILWDCISQSYVVIFERYTDPKEYIVYNANRAFIKAWSDAANDKYISGSGLVADNEIMVQFMQSTLELASVQERLRAVKAAAAH